MSLFSRGLYSSKAVLHTVAGTEWISLKLDVLFSVLSTDDTALLNVTFHLQCNFKVVKSGNSSE